MSLKAKTSNVDYLRLLRQCPFKRSILSVAIGLCSMTGVYPVMAQEQSSKPQEEALNSESSPEVIEEVFVTGTLIRGIEPTGSQAIAIDKSAITESGAVTANEILGTLPQATNLFNNNAALNPEAQTVLTVTRPNLRNLPGFSTSTGAATLVLVDGHRIVGMGVQQSAVDPDLLPPSVIDRVEVITDGGSSLYGADAIGGVINFITKKSFDGVEIDAGYSNGEDYWSYDTNITAGSSWDEGSGYVSFSHSDRDAILGGDRDWSRGGIWTSNGLTASNTECISPVGSSTTMTATDFGFLPITVWQAGTPTLVGTPCDEDARSSLIPEEDRSSVFFGVSQNFAEGITLDVKGYYSERNTTWKTYPLGDSTSFGPENFSPTGGAANGDTTMAGSVGFSYAPNSAYRDRDGETNISTYGITPELTIDLGGNWQARTTLHYSRSDNEVVEPQTNQIALQDAINSGQLDPLDVASADADVITNILNWELAGESEQELFLARVIADGPVMHLPAGDLMMAVGAEYSDQHAKLRQQESVIGGLGAAPYPRVSRDVKAIFAEFQIPLIRDMPGIEALTLSASTRYDDYSDFGSTTNPHIGLNYQPVEWVTIHANWGESFNAPTLMDTLGANATFGYFSSAAGAVEDAAAAAGVVIESGRNDVAQITGADAELDPQTATTWAAGFEISPPIIEGLVISANYYEIEFRDILGSFDPRSTSAAVAFADKYIWNPTQSELDAAAAITFNGADELVGRDAANVATIIDRRTTNTDEASLKGIDFGINYQHLVGFGTLGYSLSGNHQTEFELSSAGGEFVDQLEYGVATTLLSGSVSLHSDNLRAKLTVKYTDSFDVDDAAVVDGVPSQTSVDSFTTVDLFVGYEFQGGGLTDDLSLRLNVSNLFDEEPPLYRKNDQPSYSGFTLGRVFTLGATKRF